MAFIHFNISSNKRLQTRFCVTPFNPHCLWKKEKNVTQSVSPKYFWIIRAARLVFQPLSVSFGTICINPFFDKKAELSLTFNQIRILWKEQWPSIYFLKIFKHDFQRNWISGSGMLCPHIYYGVLGREDTKLCHLGEAVTTILNVQEKEDQQQKKKYLHAYSTRENK